MVLLPFGSGLPILRLLEKNEPSFWDRAALYCFLASLGAPLFGWLALYASQAILWGGMFDLVLGGLFLLVFAIFLSSFVSFFKFRHHARNVSALLAFLAALIAGTLSWFSASVLAGSLFSPK